MPKVKAAVLERSRRSTAGKRMSSLVGKAQEDDDTFWSHSIWSEGGGGFSSGRKRRRDDDDSSSDESSSGSDSDDSASSDGEGSFRMSDEESAAAEDQFDSDFDESESDDEEEGGEGATERELIAEERRQKASQRKKRQQVAFQGKGSLGGGRDFMGKKKKGAISTKRGPTGEGWNAGLVLNWPPPPSTELGQAATKTATAQQSQQVTAQMSSGPVVPVASVLPQQSPSKPHHAEVKQPIPSAAVTTAAVASKTKQQISPIITKSKSKITTKEHNLRASASSKKAAAAKATRRGPAAAATTTTTIEKKSTSDKKPQFTQEELIIEAIKSTETENAKWLSARKRVREEAAHLENAMAKAKTVTHNPVSRFYSRRGCTNTLTFMDMDHLPDILTRAQPPRKTSFGDSSTIRSPRKRRAGSTASQETSSSPDTVEKEQAKCVITGKIARYRDPKTMLGYYDLDAFKELRRRLDAGELPKQEKKKKKVPPTKKSTPHNASVSESTMIAKLSSTGGDVKVKVKVGNDFVPPPPAEKEKIKQTSLITQNKPKQRWDDASDNMYAKAYSSSKKQRTDPSTSRNVESVTSESNTSSQNKEAASQNGNNHTSTKGVALKLSISSSVPLSLSSSSAAAPVAEQSVTSPSEAPPATLSSNGQTSSSPKKNIAELKPTPAELNTFMQTWISRPENKDNLMPSLQQKQKIMDEIGVDKKRLEGWFYRTRKKMKQDNPSDKPTSQEVGLPSKVAEVVPNSNAGMKEGDKMNVPTKAVQSSTKNQEGGLEVSLCKPDLKGETDSPATSTKKDQSNSQSTNGAKITAISSADKSSVVNPAAKTTSSDDKTDAQIPLLPSNGNKKCEQPSKQNMNIQDMIKQSEIQT